MSATIRLLAFLILSFAAPTVPAGVQAKAVSIRAAVDRSTVYLGDPFTLRIQLEGIDNAPTQEALDVSAIKDFVVESLGRNDNNGTAITLVDGQMRKVEKRGLVYSYRLTPQKTGKCLIPAISIALGSRILQTQPIAVNVLAPETTEDFQLRLEFAKTRFYVGEPVRLRVVWYLGRDVESFTFDLPFLEDGRFIVADLEQERDADRQYHRIPLGRASAIAVKGTQALNGREYTTLSFDKVILAREPATFDISGAAVLCRIRGIETYPKVRSSPLDDLFGDEFFDAGSRAGFKVYAARPKPVTLTAIPLPEEGKPAGFSGCVGNFSIETSADPTNINIGDPITLTVSIGGSDYLEEIQLPPLYENPELNRDFKFPKEMATGIIQNGSKVFTQTLRAKTELVNEIPSISFVFFDPDRTEYRVASSKAIPIEVSPTRIVTEDDVEGKQHNELPGKNELEEWSQGIAYNYEGPDVLENHAFAASSLLRSPLWIAPSVIPFSLYLILFVSIRLHQERKAAPQKYRSRKALTKFIRKINLLHSTTEQRKEIYALLLEAVRSYLGDKMNVNGAALTSADVEQILLEQGINEEIVRQLGDLLDLCEKGRYGGGLELPVAFDKLVREVAAVISALDRQIR